MNKEMTMGKWLLTLLIISIPCVNIIMLLVWAFGNGDYPARKTFAQAYLIYLVVVFVLSFMFGFIMGLTMPAMMSTMSGYSLIMF